MENNSNEAKKTAGSVGGPYMGKLVIGMFAGMGLGFIMMAITHMSAANKK